MLEITTKASMQWKRDRRKVHSIASIGGLCHLLRKIKNDLHGVCLSVCERQREGT